MRKILFVMVLIICTIDSEQLNAQNELSYALTLDENQSTLATNGSIRWSGSDFEAYVNNQWVSMTDKKAIIETIYDIDNNSYRVMYVDDKRWMLDNLRVTKYNDGTTFSRADDYGDWTSLGTFGHPAFCYYDNDISNADIHGLLYNGHVVSSGTMLGKNICPAGWHVPSLEEFDELIEHYGGSDNAGHHLRVKGSEFWQSPNDQADNASGFSALGSGQRAGTYNGQAMITLYWLDETVGMHQKAKVIFYSSGIVSNAESSPLGGYSIRCTED